MVILEDQKLQTVYGRDNQNKQNILIFIATPTRKMKA